MFLQLFNMKNNEITKNEMNVLQSDTWLHLAQSTHRERNGLSCLLRTGRPPQTPKCMSINTILTLYFALCVLQRQCTQCDN